MLTIDEKIWRSYVRDKGLLVREMEVVKAAFLEGLKIGRGETNCMPIKAENRLKERIRVEMEWLKSDSITKDVMKGCKNLDKMFDEFEHQMKISCKTHSTMIDVRKHFYNWVQCRNDYGNNNNESKWQDEVVERIRRLASAD